MLERIRTSVTTRAGSRAGVDKAERASTTSKQYGLEGGKTRRPSHFMFDNVAVSKAGVCVVDADGVLRRHMRNSDGETLGDMRARLPTSSTVVEHSAGPSGQNLLPRRRPGESADDAAARRRAEIDQAAKRREMDQMREIEASIRRAKSRYRDLKREEKALQGRLKVARQCKNKLQLLKGRLDVEMPEPLPRPTLLDLWRGLQAAKNAPSQLFAALRRRRQEFDMQAAFGSPHGAQSTVARALHRADILLKTQAGYQRGLIVDAEGNARARFAPPIDLAPDFELAVVQSEEERSLEGRGYVISTAWMRHWLLYAMRDGNPPGPVANEVLLTPRGKISRKMKLRRDFRVVNDRVWAMLLQQHGGGPEIFVDVPTNLHGTAVSDVQSWLQQLDVCAALHVSPIQRVFIHRYAPSASSDTSGDGTGHDIEINDKTCDHTSYYCHTGVLQLRLTQGLGALLDDLATRTYLFVLASCCDINTGAEPEHATDARADDGSMVLSWYSVQGTGEDKPVGTFLVAPGCGLHVNETECTLTLGAPGANRALAGNNEKDSGSGVPRRFEAGVAEAESRATLQGEHEGMVSEGADVVITPQSQLRKSERGLCLVARDTKALHAWAALLGPLCSSIPDAYRQDTVDAGGLAAGILLGSVASDKMKAARALDADINAAQAEALAASLGGDMAKKKMQKAMAMDGEINAAAAEAVANSLAGDMATRQMAEAMKLEEEAKAEAAAAVANSLGGDMAKRQMAQAQKMEEEAKAETAAANARLLAGSANKQKLAEARKLEEQAQAKRAQALGQRLGGSIAKKQLVAAIEAGNHAAAADAAARMLQAAWRTELSRREARKVADEKRAKMLDASARMLQNAWRTLQARRKAQRIRAAKEQKAQDAAARMFQSAWRTRKARQRSAELRAAKEVKAQEAAARMFQSAWRTRKARQKVEGLKAEKQRLQEEASASMMQAAWRTRKARKRVEGLKAEKRRLLEEASALMMQGAWRRRKARGMLAAKRDERDEKQALDAKHRAATLFQSALRRLQAQGAAEQMGRAVPRPFRVTVRNAEGLRAADGNTSDPFVFVTALHGADDSQQLFVSKSNVAKKNLNPEWQHSILLPRCDGNTTLTFTVCDWDRFSRNDFLGQAVLRMQRTPGAWARKQEFSLGLAEWQISVLDNERKPVKLNDTDQTGQGKVHIEVEPWFASTSASLRVARKVKKSGLSALKKSSSWEDCFLVVGGGSLHIVEANNLTSAGTPVPLELVVAVTHKTSVDGNTLVLEITLAGASGDVGKTEYLCHEDEAAVMAWEQRLQHIIEFMNKYEHKDSC